MTQIEIFLVLELIVTAVWLIFCMRNVDKCMDEIFDLWCAMCGAMELIDVLCEERETLQKERLRTPEGSQVACGDRPGRIEDSSRTPLDTREDDLK